MVLNLCCHGVCSGDPGHRSSAMGSPGHHSGGSVAAYRQNVAQVLTYLACMLMGLILILWGMNNCG